MSGAPLAGRVAVVSGGGRGIGRAIALELSAQGASVVVNNRNRTTNEAGLGPADAVVAEIRSLGGTASAHCGEAEDPETGSSMIRSALLEFGRIDICIANAAINRAGMFHNQHDVDFDDVVSINLGGAASLLRAAMTEMRRNGYGRNVIVSSTGGLHGVLGESAYAASKGGLIALGRSLALEGERRSVLTNVILPYAATQMTKGSLLDPKIEGLLTPQWVAAVVGAIVNESSSINGEVIVVGAGRIRRAASVEFETVKLPEGRLSAPTLDTLLSASGAGRACEFPSALDAFESFIGS